MKFKFTYHASYRMFLQRNISADEIRSVILHPEGKFTTDQGLTKVTKQVVNGTLRVVYYISKKKEYIIISAYYL